MRVQTSRSLRYRWQNRLISFGLVLPAVALFVFIIGLSAVMGFGFSLTDWSGMTSDIRYIGFDNYRRLFSDPVFYTAITNTLFLTVIVTLAQNTSGILLAVAVNRKGFKGRNFFRALFFIPSLLSIIVIGYTWIYILNPQMGTLRYILQLFGVAKGFIQYDPMIERFSALFTIAMTMIWQYSGYSMVIYLSGLQGISPELYESASMDGASAVRQFFHITLPMLMPSITINVFLTMIGCLKCFEQVYVMTGGGPGNATETIGTYIYNSAFSGSQMGFGTAISTILFLGILTLSVAQVKFFRAREVEL